MNYIKRSWLLVTILISLCTCFLTGCKDDVDTTGDEPVDILLVTDYGTINDGSFNEGAWNGIMKFIPETSFTADYYSPDSTDKASFLAQIKRGVKNGAKVIVCPGYLLEETVFEAQKKYPDVNFILLDGVPHNEDSSDTTIEKNCMCIEFTEEQAGFLAGYAAVREGYTGLGFMGGVPEDPVIRYGYGFVQGADYAAIEMGVNVHIRYEYIDTFSDEPIVEVTASAWYDDDTEVIFACGGELGKGVMRAAENHEGKVIGVDIDQSQDSEVVITSAMKSLEDAVCYGLRQYANGTFLGGEVTKFSAAEGGVMLPMNTSRFERFSEEDYNNIYQRFIDGRIVPYDHTDIATTQELTLMNTEVTYIMPQ